MATLLATQCPKCSSDRTRNVSLTASGYHRCDACEYVFRPAQVPPMQSRETEPLQNCKKCGSIHTQVIGRVGTPSLVVAKCRVCGHMSSLAA
jgi:rubredoxin